MTTPRVSGAVRWMAEPEPVTPSAVEELLKLLGKTARAHQMYLRNNPTYLRALALLREAFDRLWTHLPDLPLTVTESALLWEERVVFQEPERASDTLPWLLFKDGIRELRLLPGFEGEEVERLLEVLHALRRPGDADDDAVTLLWEGDYSYLRYRHVEPADGETRGFPQSDEPGRLPAGVAPVAARPPGVVDLRDFDGTIYFLSPPELDYLRAELAREYAHDLRSDVAAMLLDTFEQNTAPEVRDEICAALEQLLPVLLVGGYFRAVAALLREVATASARGAGIEPRHAVRLSALAYRLSTPEAVDQLVAAIDAAPTPVAEGELHQLLGQLHASALGPLLAASERVQSARLRAALQAAADRLIGENSAPLLTLIEGADPVVAREAAARAGRLQLAAAVPQLGQLATRGDAAQRLVAAEALGRIGTTGALQQLAGLIDDEQRDIRLVALRALARGGYRGALATLEPLVRERRGRALDLTEQMLVFEAYGACCGDAGVALLDGLLNGRSLLRGRADAPVRACAAVALGRIGSPRATQSLAKAGEEKDPVVRRAVQRALRGEP